MLEVGYDYKPEPYAAYRNRTMTKHRDKIDNQLRQIKECSLRPEDKKKLMNELIQKIQEKL